MCKSVVLNLGKGNLENGFSFINALLESDSQKIQVTGSLAPAPKLKDIYRRWQLLYNLIYQSRSFNLRSRESNIVIDETGITNISDGDFADVCRELQKCLNDWLEDSKFRAIQRQLRNQLNPSDEIRFIIQTEDYQISQIPWYVWQFFEDYPQAEVSLSNLSFQSGKKKHECSRKVRILAILGDTEGIDVEADRRLLKNLDNADTVFLVKPSCQELNEQLWSQQGWDILFFAGHSSTNYQKGKLYINPDECITLTQLKYSLQKAIARGLQLAIFNSCEGLGLAQYLSDLNIPQTIVMREPVPDRVAQEFLKHFLTGFSGGQSFYVAVREAREKLQGIEKEFPGASWLPVVFQNPATPIPSWKQLCQKSSSDRHPKCSRLKIAKAFLGSILTTTLITGLRWQGSLQAIELKSFDHLTRLMPETTVDDRILIIGADEKDISSQGYGYPLPDLVLARVLQKLKQYRPAAIGIDIFRDRPILIENSQENKAFTTLLQQNPYIVTVCTGQNADSSIAPPSGSSPHQAAFADLYDDFNITNGRDYTVRRYLLSRSPNPISQESLCKTPYSFALQLAYRYFQSKNISVKTVGENWQFGSTTIKRLQNKSGGYQKFDSRGNQLLIRYRNTPHIARQITVRDLLSDNGNFDPTWIENRIVLIGVTAATVPDIHDTPSGKLRGLHVHAHALSQMLDLATENSSLFWWLPQWGDILWIWFCSFTGGIIILVWQSPIQRGVAMSGSVIALYGFCWFFFTKNGWLPLVPGILALFLTGSGLIIYSFLKQKYGQKENRAFEEKKLNA